MRFPFLRSRPRALLLAGPRPRHWSLDAARWSCRGRAVPCV